MVEASSFSCMGSNNMTMSQTDVDKIPSGPGAAAILAAGIGSAALGILALAGDASDAINKFLNFYKPTGATFWRVVVGDHHLANSLVCAGQIVGYQDGRCR